MGSDSKPLSGPDLEKGVAWRDLREGEPLLGQAFGEAVILVRRGEDACALGATCTHYGGPLAEGLVVGDTVRCPWHHARFSLRSGQAVGAPALNPLPCFQVERRDDLVRVTGKRPEVPPPEAAGPRSVVIVGAGPAGAACAETLRKEGYKGPVTLVGDEPPGPVDRPNLSKDYLAGTAPEEWIPLRGSEFYAEIGVDFVLGDPAVRLDPAAHTVTLAGGRSLSYGALVLATGAQPRRLNVPGADAATVLLLRTLEQSRAIIAAATAASAKRAVLVGASFIGLEVAASLRKRGLEVDVVGPEPVPLGRVLGDEVGEFVQRIHEQNGVRFHLDTGVARILPDAVELQTGTRLPADLIVTGVGIIPRTELGQAAGVAVDNGYVVDERLRTNVADVYAAGDVARFPDPRVGTHIRIEHFVVAERQGQAAARSILGRGGPYRDVPFFWSQHHDVTLSYVGHAPGWDRIESRGSLDARDYAAFYLRGGRVLAVLTVGRDQLLLRAEAALEAGDDVAINALMSA